jgi:asparaginyl-tRNA synthetase
MPASVVSVLPTTPASPASAAARTVLPPPREHLCSPVTRTLIRMQNEVLAETRRLLAQEGFIEILPPVIGPVTDPGIRGSKQVDLDYYGHRYRLMTSAILYKQASLLAFDRIFCIAPNVRLEPQETAGTGRHLTEFHQVDVEIAGATREEAMAVAESIVRHAAARVLQSLSEELAGLGRDLGALSALADLPFARITHPEAVSALLAGGHSQDAASEINWQAEAWLSHTYRAPFFITDYPKGCRGFYDREDAAHPGVLRSFDLLAPEGYGEIVSGAERESDYATIVARMRETGENPAKYGWYLELLRGGVPASAGFGLGLERLLRYLSGLPDVTQVTAFPKLAGVVSP